MLFLHIKWNISELPRDGKLTIRNGGGGKVVPHLPLWAYLIVRKIYFPLSVSSWKLFYMQKNLVCEMKSFLAHKTDLYFWFEASFLQFQTFFLYHSFEGLFFFAIALNFPSVLRRNRGFWLKKRSDVKTNWVVKFFK